MRSVVSGICGFAAALVLVAGTAEANFISSYTDDLIRALNRIAAAEERQARAAERTASAVEDIRDQL